MQRYAITGLIVGSVPKPQFKTKDLLHIFDLPPLPEELYKLTEWLRAYYPAPLGVVAQQILPGSFVAKTLSETTGLTDMPDLTSTDLPPLTPDQVAILHQISKPDTYLLHGDTGTGKTRVYIELTRRSLAADKSAIILTPEIGLTSQLAANFRQVFGERVVVVHSQMTPKMRLQSWLKIIRSTVPLVVLGPRSALFSPLPNIGLIVVDEAHEPAYKQEKAPHYHASRVASQLARLHEATLVLGSATPSVGDYYVAERLAKPILRMTHMAAASHAQSRDELVTTTVIDLKDRNQFTRSQYLSTTLLRSIDTSLSRGEQSLLYLNRRGTARVILCNNCGWQAVCPHCDLPLTYHHDVHALQCHTCGFQSSAPTACPECGQTDVVFKVVGTKAIEEEVRRLYPKARIMRFDTDNKKSERFEQHYDAVQAGDIDILIGTQLLAKGLDLPKLSTLGIVIADTSLTFPDYSAEERTFQLLAQVVGRVGRGHRNIAGQSVEQRVVVQSYAPERPVITAALARDYAAFYQNELRERELFYFPPYCYALKLTVRRASSKSAEQASEQFLYAIKDLALPLLVEGPMPSFHARIENKFEWQLIVKSKQRAALLRIIALLKSDAKSGWNYDIDPVNLL
jgi:primosomal protein N' (replication factor Y)